jgi:hypothetical protein
MEGRGRGFSLWLTPDGESSARLSALIAGLAARLGTPRFVPHLTLIPGLEGDEEDLVRRTEGLGRRLPSLRVRLGPVETTGDYFRCLYRRAEPVAALRAAHSLAAEAFGVRSDPAFLPHLSLLYCHLEAAEGGRITAELEDSPRAFEVVSLGLWRTEGLVGEWERRASFDLART